MLLTKEVISSVLVAAMAIGTVKMLDKVSKYKRLNQAVDIGGSCLALNYLRCKNKIPVVGDLNINHKHTKAKE